MMVQNMGQIIRSERIKRGYTQEELSFGICTTATLSRIECGLHNPTRAIIRAVLDKLGNVDYNFVELEGKSISEVSIKKQRIAKYLFTEQISEARKELELLQSKQVSEELLDQQFLGAANAFVDIYEHKYSISTYHDLLKLIRLTIVNYNQKQELNYILTFNETFLILVIAYYELMTSNIEVGKDMLEKLLSSIRKRTMNIGIENALYSSAEKLYAYAWFLEGNYKKALNVLDNMIQYCTASGSIDEVALVAKEKAICESKLGYMEQTKETVLNSYYALKAMKLYRAAECLKSYAAKYLKLEFHATYMIGE